MSIESTKVLMVARNLLEQGWCKYAEARDAHRKPTSLYGKRVSAVSLGGAVKLAIISLRLKNKPRTETQVLKTLLTQVTDNPDLIGYNGDAYDALDAYNDCVAKSKRDVLKVFYAVLGEDGK